MKQFLTVKNNVQWIIRVNSGARTADVVTSSSQLLVQSQKDLSSFRVWTFKTRFQRNTSLYSVDLELRNGSSVVWLPVCWLPVCWLPVCWLPVGWLPVCWLPVGWLPVCWLPVGWLPVCWGPFPGVEVTVPQCPLVAVLMVTGKRYSEVFTSLSARGAAGRFVRRWPRWPTHTLSWRAAGASWTLPCDGTLNYGWQSLESRHARNTHSHTHTHTQCYGHGNYSQRHPTRLKC